MAPPGGPANVYGILYQLLGTLNHVVRLAIRPGDLRDSVSPPLVIIEPIGGGGDLRVQDDRGVRTAIQFKSRADGGTWSLNDIIEEVLPDLYKAVDANRLAQDDRYQFATEGRIGAWAEAMAFFEQLAPGSPPTDPLRALSDQALVRIASGRYVSHSDLFQQVVAALRRHGEAEEPIELTRQKAWHLLRGLEFVSSSFDDLKAMVDDRLSRHAPAGEPVADLRGRLVVTLLELAGTGGVEIDPVELLALARVTLEPLKAFAEVREHLHKLLEVRFAELRYRAALDVRATPPRGERQVLIFAGDSGDGKTWRLCNLAQRSLDNGFAIVRTATGQGHETWARSLEIAWGVVGTPRTAPLGLLLERLRADDTGARPDHIDVLVDNVQRSEEATALIIRVRDEPREVRLVLTVPLELGRSLQAAHPDIELIEVPRFDDQEFEQFCERRGLDWRRIPRSVRPTLHQPLLAEMYARTVDDGRIQPEFEYEVFEVYWRRLFDLPEQFEHRGDASVLANLAASSIEDGSGARAWGQTELRAQGADDGWQNRVERAGWLQRVADDDVRIWHDRLFGWAAAKGIIERRRHGMLSSDALAQRIRTWGVRTGDGSGFGALALDVIWLAADPAGALTGDVAGLLDAFEQSVGTELLHDTLLPRLGLRIREPLLARLRRRSGDQQDLRRAARYTATTLIELAKHRPGAISDAAGQLIHDQSEILREAGLLVLHTVPNPAQLDQMWKLHRRSVLAMEKRDEGAVRSYRLTFDALRRSIDGAPEWLANRIREADPEIEPIQELAYLLAGLRSGDPAQLWTELKPLLVANVTESKARALVACIRRFRDTQEIQRLRGWLTKEEVPFLGVYAFAALAVIAPTVALEVLDTLPVQVLALASNLAMPMLLHLLPSEVLERLRKRLIEKPAEFWLLASVYRESENQLDAETVTVMLNRLEADLGGCSQEDDEVSLDVHRALEYLSRIWRADLLDLFEAKRGTPLESKLAGMATQRVGKTGVSMDYDLENARLVLLKINGDGWTALVETELASAVPVVQRGGVRAATVRSSLVARAVLRELATDPNTSDDGQTEETIHEAVEALAVLGETDAMIRAIVHGSGKVVSYTLAELRAEGEPFDGAQIARLLQLLQSPVAETARRAALAIGISKRPELAPELVARLLKSPTGSDLAFGVILGLSCLGTANAAAIPALAAHLALDGKKKWAQKILVRIGTPAALAAVREGAMASVTTDVDFSLECMIDLVTWSSEKDEAVALLWQTIQQLPSDHLPPAEALDVLAAGAHDGVEQYLHDIAFGPDRLHYENQPEFRAEAIRALSRLSRRTALSAVEWALTEPLLGREHLPRVLLDIDVRTGLEMMVRLAPLLEPERRWTASRELRRHLRPDMSSQVTEAISRLLNSPDPVEREAGVDLARFLEPARFLNRLERLFIDDHDVRVQDAVSGALRVQQGERLASTLVGRLERADDNIWPALYGITALADPDRLDTDEASLIPLPTRSALTLAMRRILRLRIDKRREERESAERTEAVRREGKRQSVYPASGTSTVPPVHKPNPLP
jgi:hypothetical protein